MKVLFTEKTSKQRTLVSYAVSFVLFTLLGGVAPQIFTGDALAQIPFAQGVIAQNNNAVQINWQSDLNTAAVLAKAQNKLMIVHFYGKNCPPCKTMDTDVYTDPRVIAELNQRFVPVKIDTGVNPELVKQFDIKAIPTNLVIDENGKTIDKRQGGISADRFCQYLTYLQTTAGKTAVQSATAALSVPAPVPAAVPVPPLRTGTAFEPVSQPVAAAQPIQQPVSQPIPQTNQLVLNDPFLQQVSQPAVQPVQQQQVVQQSAESVKNPNPMRTAETAAPVAATHSPVVASAVTPSSAAVPVVLPENYETVKPLMIELPLALDGYCPVVLTNEERWVQGNPQLYAMFQGLVYHFSSGEALQTFIENPLKYAPAMKGEDVVLLAERSRQNFGSRKFGAWFEGRVYLFSCQETLNVFAAKPEHYAAFAKQSETAQHTSLNTVQR